MYYLNQFEGCFLIQSLDLRGSTENRKEQRTGTNLEPQRGHCSSQTAWRAPYAVSLYANQGWETATIVNAQEASESQKFLLLPLTIVPHKNSPVPCLTPPSLLVCSQHASQSLSTLTSSGCTYMGEEKTLCARSTAQGEVLFQLPEKHCCWAHVLYHCSQRAR